MPRARVGHTPQSRICGMNTAKGLEVLPRRWVVELTFAWLGKEVSLDEDPIDYAQHEAKRVDSPVF